MATIVADNGGYSLRLGYAHEEEPKLIVPNQVATIRNDGRELVADETESSNLRHHEFLEYRRPHQRGCLLDGFTEEKIWTRALSQLGGFAITDNKKLIVTEAPVQPMLSKRISDELFFEKLKFDRVARVPAQACVGADADGKANWDNGRHLIKIIVDCGYSATWVVPLIDINAPFPFAVKRVDVGGKLLTNLLKEELTWRHFNLMDDTFVVEKCKRSVCYVAQDLKLEKPTAVDFLLPDHVNDSQGRVLQSEEQIDFNKRQVIRVSQERINTPETLFRPSRIGLDEAGVAEAVFQCVQDLPWELRDEALKCVVVTGGSCCFAGFMNRIKTELAEFGCYNVVDWSAHYEISAWRGAAMMANSPRFFDLSVSKAQYEEEGSYHRGSSKRRPMSETADYWWTLD